MSLPKPEPLCRYRYDPLDRLAGSSALGQAGTRCFYHLNRLTTDIQGQIGTSWLQAQDQLLAQWQQDTGKHEHVLIATDAPGSVIHALGGDQSRAFGYMPYGTRMPKQAPLHLPGFNSERLDPVTGHYLLGNGYRAFNPVLMRFNSPDSLSPFGEGGLNAYGYCGGDPVNRVDPTGNFFKKIIAFFGYSPSTEFKLFKGGMISYEYISNEGLKTIAFQAHATSELREGYHALMLNSVRHTPQDLYKMAVDAGIDFSRYDQASLMACLSASGQSSLAQQFSNLLQKPVVGYKGLFYSRTSTDRIIQLLQNRSEKIIKHPDGTYHYKGVLKPMKRSKPVTLYPSVSPSNNSSPSNLARDIRTLT
ncbi:hypothetical protein PS3A_20800 [Pseudomonas sp. 3A(2025)]